jgi:hypothetical protein
MIQKTGLVYIAFSPDNPKEPTRFIDSSISALGQYGFEIIIRLEDVRASETIIMELKSAFKKPFGLPDDHYVFEPTFWRTYWDKGDLSINKLEECERLLDEIARKNGILIRSNGLVVQPRSLDYLKEWIGVHANSKK